MTSFQLIRRSLFYYWRTNLAVMCGVAVATAVIGGALLVGDSVRASLRQLTLDRLGQIDVALTGQRFIRQQTAEDLAAFVGNNSLAPALVMSGAMERIQAGTHHRAGQTTIYALDERAWSLIDHGGLALPTGAEIVLGARTAEALSARVGDRLTLWLELPTSVPRDTLLGQRDNETAEVSVTVTAIASERSGLSRLSLQPNQQLPFTGFVSLVMLQDRLDLSAVKPSRRDPEGRPSRINTLFAASPDPRLATLLTEGLRARWKPADVGLRVTVNDREQLIVVDSTQMILEEPLAQAVQEAAGSLGVTTSGVQVYLANWLRNAKDEAAYSMYSVVAGLDLLGQDPELFGTWEFSGPRPERLGERDIILNEWLAADLRVQTGDTVRLGYHLVGSHGELPEEETTFQVAGIVRMTGASLDATLTPAVKGITDADTFGDWQQPFPMKLDQVTKRDDAYWARYRATPKAFVSLDTAQALWRSRYGKLTSLRISRKPGQSAEDLREEFVGNLMKQLEPARLGLAFQPVKAQGLAASAGATDFTGLFVGFSFFLIFAATILIGLLLRLGLEQRVRHWGLLGAVGFTPGQVQTLMFCEGSCLAIPGALLGLPAAVGYARLMIYGLTTWWVGAIRTTELFLTVNPVSLLIGLAVSLTAAALAIGWGVRNMRSVSVRGQLAGLVEAPVSVEALSRRGHRAGLRALLAGLGALLMIAAALVGIVPAGEAFSGLGWPVVVFFIAGMLLLSASLWSLSARLQTDRTMAVRGHGLVASCRLGLRSASRQRARSVLTAGLIASAAFVIAAVAAGQINPIRQRPEKFSGNGGFTLVAESSRPILYDLNTPAGRKQLGIITEPDSPAANLWSRMKIMQFRVNPGEDASCLNLYQTRIPTILGTPREMVERGGFTFANAGRSQPWQHLAGSFGDDTVPVLGDMNTLMFSLKKGMGAEIPVPHPEDPRHRLKVAGMFHGAVFQGVLLMSDAEFQRIYPDRKGYQYFLIEVDPGQAPAATELLESSLAAWGFDAEPVSERLARFLSVQNTYLSTFQALGGLGLLLGTLGLATVMLRNIRERQGEIALLRAVGFSSLSIGQLILWEAVFLLLWGMLSGIASALIAMLPHLRSTGADVPWGSVALLFMAVFVCGLCSAVVAIRSAVRVPIVATLRGE